MGFLHELPVWVEHKMHREMPALSALHPKTGTQKLPHQTGQCIALLHAWESWKVKRVCVGGVHGFGVIPAVPKTSPAAFVYSCPSVTLLGAGSDREPSPSCSCSGISPHTPPH